MATRRGVMALAAGLIPLGVVAAKADGSPISMASVGYRDVPYNGQVCAQCVYFEFEPMANGQPRSRCKMVAGIINPAGWCEIYAPKG